MSIALSTGVTPTHDRTTAMDASSGSVSRFPATRPQDNRLLAALPAADLQRWRPQLELVGMAAGLTLCHGGEYGTHVYFPTSASVSMLHVTRGGHSLEVVAVGNEGMVGMPVLMSGGATMGEAVVRTGGQGFRLRSAWIQNEFHTCGPVMGLMLRYAHALMAHTAQSAICNKHHSLEQRLCRCFLSCLDRTDGAPLSLTHEAMACMLGVRREGVTCAALKLQRAGLIDYARGLVVVVDRSALENLSCECYEVIRTEYAQLSYASPGLQRVSGGMNTLQLSAQRRPVNTLDGAMAE